MEVFHFEGHGNESVPPVSADWYVAVARPKRPTPNSQQRVPPPRVGLWLVSMCVPRSAMSFGPSFLLIEVPVQTARNAKDCQRTQGQAELVVTDRAGARPTTDKLVIVSVTRQTWRESCEPFACTPVMHAQRSFGASIPLQACYPCMRFFLGGCSPASTTAVTTILNSVAIPYRQSPQSEDRVRILTPPAFTQGKFQY